MAERAVKDGYNIIILSDRAVSAERVASPALLATSATHHHLIRKGLRTSVGLVVESGEPVRLDDHSRRLRQATEAAMYSGL